MIVNCAGLGARELAVDPTVEPHRGALLRVVNDGASMSRVTAAHAVANDTSSESQNMVFIVPRGADRLLLGGLVEPGEYDTDLELDGYPPLREMFDRCRDFLPVLRDAELDAADPLRVGLRPFRAGGVRLDVQPGTRIVHNYGHGGAGVTLSWGCAHEVAETRRHNCSPGRASPEPSHQTQWDSVSRRPERITMMMAMPAPEWVTLLAWIVTTVGVLVAGAMLADIYLGGYRQPLRAMEAVWPITAVYAGPLAWWAYHRWGRPATRQWQQHERAPRMGLSATAAVQTIPGGAVSFVGHMIAMPLVMWTGVTIAGQGVWPMMLLIAAFALPLLIAFEYHSLSRSGRPQSGGPAPVGGDADLVPRDPCFRCRHGRIHADRRIRVGVLPRVHGVLAGDVGRHVAGVCDRLSDGVVVALAGKDGRDRPGRRHRGPRRWNGHSESRPLHQHATRSPGRCRV